MKMLPTFTSPCKVSIEYRYCRQLTTSSKILHISFSGIGFLILQQFWI
jgi:hypothetical protein